MHVIVNKEQKDIPISFEGFDYIFSAGKPAQVEDILFNFLQELLPMSFDFKPDLSKIKVVAKVQRTPTKTVFPGGKFGVPSANLTKEVADDLPTNGQIDKDGVSWVGDGLEDDKL
jgi:hypothetical protein